MPATKTWTATVAAADVQVGDFLVFGTRRTSVPVVEVTPHLNGTGLVTIRYGRSSTIRRSGDLMVVTR